MAFAFEIVGSLAWSLVLQAWIHYVSQACVVGAFLWSAKKEATGEWDREVRRTFHQDTKPYTLAGLAIGGQHMDRGSTRRSC